MTLASKQYSLDSKQIKTALCHFFRFRKGCKYIATEAGQFNSDFLAIMKNDLIEVEVKTSRQDFLQDFKKVKHTFYKNPNHKWTPNYFYFAVPKELIEIAHLKCLGTKYGVLLIRDRLLENGRYLEFQEMPTTVKRAQRLTENKATQDHIHYICARMSSELCGLRARSTDSAQKLL